MKFREYLLIIFLLIITLSLRLYNLGGMPKGLSTDEAALGYNAYSILKTGKDEYGVRLPLAFKSFGEYKAPLYIYLTVPVIRLFGLSEFTSRFPSAIFGTLTVLSLYLLVKLIDKNTKVAFFSSLILSLLPWHIQFSRFAYEGSLTLFLLTLATYFFVKGLKNKIIFILSFILFGLTFYSHYSVRLFTPLYLIALIGIYRKDLLLIKSTLLTGIISIIIILVPLSPYLFSQAGLSRAGYISFLTDSGLTFSINEKRAEHLWSETKIIIPSNIIHNKISEYLRKFLDNYVSHFDLSFLLVKGDEDRIYKTPFIGLFLYSFILLLFIGLLNLFSKFGKSSQLILFWLLISPISSSLTRLSASSNRAFMMVVPLVMISGLGLSKLTDRLHLDRSRKYLVFSFCLIFLAEYFYYLDSYYIHQNIKNFNDKRFGSKEIVHLIQNISGNYDKIWVTNKLGSYIHFLFYLQYPPDRYQKDIKTTIPDEFGFNVVNSFDKYNFEPIPKYFDFSKRILYVCPKGEEPENIDPIFQTYYPDGRIEYLVFDTEKIKEICNLCNLESKPKNIDIFGNLIK